MRVVAVDPGSAQSAIVRYDTDERIPFEPVILPNEETLRFLERAAGDHLAIEMAESFGAKVWSQVFTTVLWTGRFVQAWGRDFTLVTRRQVKLAVTGSPSAKDGQIRQCLIDRWGGKDAAIGRKKSPGPLFGVTADCWQALAVAVTYAEQRS